MPVDHFEPIFRLSANLPGIRSSISRKMVLHPNCRKCRQQERGKWTPHPMYSPALDRYWDKVLRRMRSGAQSRGLVVAISKDDVLGLYLRQEGRCALTGLKMDWKAKGGTGRNRRAMGQPSVDRIDSNGNYTLDNIQIVLAAVNMMKNDLSNDHFVALCEQVASHRLSGGLSL